MLNKLYTLLAATIMLFGISSCGDKEVTYSLGTVEYYEDFMWVKYEAPTSTKSLKLVFMDDAIDEKCSFTMGLYTPGKDGNKEQIDTGIVQLYVNGEVAEENCFTVTNQAEDGSLMKTAELELGFILGEKAMEGHHKWLLCEHGNNNSIEEIAIENEDNRLIFEIEKVEIWNPLLKWLTIFFGTFIAANIIWLLILRPIYFKKFAIKKISIVGPAPYMQSLNVNGKYLKVVLTNKPKEQGFFEKVYKGEIKYIGNAIWTEDIELLPKDKKSIRIRVVKPNGVFRTDYTNVTLGKVCKITNTETKGITEITIK